MLSPSASPAPIPTAKGTTAPPTPTPTAVGPTAFISESRVSSPTQKSRKTTPSSAKTSITSLTSTRPRTEGPINRPPRISPMIAGWPIHLKNLVAEAWRRAEDQEEVGEDLAGAAGGDRQVERHALSCCPRPLGAG
ncbi:MAG: hypothetical protein R2725_06145 [Solirubrobacterales bacterium]